MATYYIDYANGSDAASGTSTGAAWKHCPGDPNATGTAGAKTPAAGDIFNFKGGVRYRGKIQALASGTIGNQITYQGQPAGWGTGKALIDGTAALALSVCTGNGTGTGQVPNANFASIYYGTLPASTDVFAPVLENDTWLNITQTASQPVPFFFKNAYYFDLNTGGVGQTSTTDAARLTQSGSTYWVGAYILMRSSPGNDPIASKISAFNSATHTITYADEGAVYADNYSIISEPRILSAPGQYAIDENRGLVFVWPSADSTAVSIGSLSYGFHTNGQSYLTIDGFTASGQYGTGFVSGRAISGSTSTPTDGVIVVNCDFKNQSDGFGELASGTTYMFGAGTSENSVSYCTFSYIHGRGPFICGNLIAARHNEVSFIDATCFYSQNGPGAVPNINGDFSYNYLHDIQGVHQNGITIYGQAGGTGNNYAASNWTVHHNIVKGMNNPYGYSALSMQGHRNVDVYNNLFEADGGCSIDDLAAGSTYYRWWNNTVVVPANTLGSAISGTIRTFGLANNSAPMVFQNNICNGLIISSGGSSDPVDWTQVTHDHNIYTALSSSQTGGHGWSLGTGESTGTASALFASPSLDDYRLKVGSAAIASGIDLSSNFTTDLSNRTRIVPWDLGAYMYPATGYISSARFPTRAISVTLA